MNVITECPHGHVYGTCLMCYHDLMAEQQGTIESLTTEREHWRSEANRISRAALKLHKERDCLLRNNESLREQLARAERRINSLTEALADL